MTNAHSVSLREMLAGGRWNRGSENRGSGNHGRRKSMESESF